MRGAQLGAFAGTHPIFKCNNVQLLWWDNVQKKNRHGGLQQRLLAVTSAGLFLFERRKFPRGIVLSRVLSFGDLLLVRVDELAMEFFAPKVTMVLQHEDHVHVAAIVCAVRRVLFGDKPRPVKIVIEDPEIQRRIDADEFVFHSESVLADRFLSLCLAIETSVLIPDQVNYLYDTLKSCDGCFQFNAETIASPLCLPVALAIAYDEKLEAVRLRNLNFASFMPYYMNIIQYNSSVKRVTFSSVSFDGSVKPYVDVWAKKTQFSANQMIFNDCQLVTPDFLAFLEAFEMYPADMSNISFVRCTMSKEVLEALFESVYVSPCFRTLSDLSISETRSGDLLQVYVLQFLSSNFLINQKHLNIVSFSDCCLDLNILFPFFFKFETAVQSVVLTGNRFTVGDSLSEIDDFQNVSELTLSNSSFTGDTLLKLFQVLAKAKRAPKTLALDALKIDEVGWNTFYAGIADVKIESLKLLSWCNNPMRAKQMVSFKQFLLNQPSLTDLGLSNSIMFIDADACLGYLVDIAKSINLEKLEIRAAGAQTFGRKLHPLLQVLLERKTIKMLDVTGQGVSDEGLNLLVQLASTCLDELRFDGSGPSTYDVFLDIVSKLKGSRLLHSEWPVEDAKEVTAKIPLSSRQQIMRQIEKARKEFLDKLALHSRSEEVIQDVHATERRTSILNRGSTAESAVAGTLPVVIDEEIIACCEPFVASALAEIFGPKKTPDPLVVTIEELEKATSLSTYISVTE